MTIPLDTVQRALAERYRIESRLGGGGMADVFAGEEAASGRKVAVKVLRPEFAATLLGERFHREIAFLSGLNHPNILPLLESSEAAGFVFYTMPFAGGESLKRRLEREGRLSLDDTLTVTRDVAAGIDHAHERQVIHRDIKPHNVMFHEGRATICDFGVARALVKAGGERLSTSGLVVGTPYYMSPEQVGGSRDIDHRADIYSLACVVYQMLVGEPPFTGRTAQAVMAKHARERPPVLRVVRSEIPECVEAALLRALAKNPAGRPASAGALVAEMEA
ncbi:MAG: serine/threonine-protein kinase [Gemmatimonadales bacterium]